MSSIVPQVQVGTSATYNILRRLGKGGFGFVIMQLPQYAAYVRPMIRLCTARHATIPCLTKCSARRFVYLGQKTIHGRATAKPAQVNVVL